MVLKPSTSKRDSFAFFHEKNKNNNSLDARMETKVCVIQVKHSKNHKNHDEKKEIRNQ